MREKCCTFPRIFSHFLTKILANGMEWALSLVFIFNIKKRFCKSDVCSGIGRRKTSIGVLVGIIRFQAKWSAREINKHVSVYATCIENNLRRKSGQLFLDLGIAYFYLPYIICKKILNFSVRNGIFYALFIIIVSESIK